MTPSLRPHGSTGQPEPRTHPSLCPKIQEKKTCLKMWEEHLILVSRLVVRKLTGMRLGSTIGIRGAGKAIASGDNRFGELFIYHIWLLGSLIFISSFNLTSGKGRSKN